MKLKYHVVEYISYQSEDGYPGLGTDPNTMERIHFLSKKKAKKFIKRFIASDPGHVKMWIASITLHTITEKIKMVKYPSEWEKVAISKKGRESMLVEDAPNFRNKTGFDKYVDEQMQSPSFVEAFEEAGKQLAAERKESNNGTEIQNN